MVMCYVFKLHLAAQNRKFEREEGEKGLPQGFRYVL